MVAHMEIFSCILSYYHPAKMAQFLLLQVGFTWTSKATTGPLIHNIKPWEETLKVSEQCQK